MITKQQHTNIYQPFCYLIGWSALKKFYYGVRYAKGTIPSDLWTKYYTSSKYVAKYREKYGEPDIIQVRKVFTTAKDAILWEEKVIRRLNAIYQECWLNKNNTSSGARRIVNEPKSDEQKERQRQLMTGKRHSQETKNKISAGLKAYKRTKEHSNNLSLSLKNIKKPTLMTGEYRPCEICQANIYQTRYMLCKGYIKKTCSKECKSKLTRLNYLRRFNRI